MKILMLWGVILEIMVLGTTAAAADETPARQAEIEQCLADSEQPADCIGLTLETCLDAAGTFEDQYACYDDETAGWDAILNQYYQADMAQLKELAAGSTTNEEAANAFQKAQRAWIAFRDAECDAEFAELATGMIDSQLNLADCLNRMTAERAIEIRPQ
ncbi:lysozyme inhibitor LprI family protein [Consotaella aegiceratis]|uniref:lysozyme inhibitor LprI family protein n=1 Tax=Consotaella aegiceratis TaxID=3097961 RepID=UPI002F425534